MDSLPVPPPPLLSSTEHQLLEDHEILNPSFRFDPSTDTDGRPVGKLYIEAFVRSEVDTFKWESAPSVAWPLIASVTSDRIRMYPIHTNPHAKRYLRSRHPQFRSIDYYDGDGREMPTSAEQAVSHIESRLPWGLFNEAHEGFGFVKELNEAVRTTGRFVNGTVLVVAKNGESRLDGENVIVSESDMDSLRRAMNRIDRRKRAGVQHAKQTVVFNDLLTKLDPGHFGRSDDALGTQPTSTVGMARSRRVTVRERQTGEAAIANVRARLPTLAATAPSMLIELRAEIERVTLAEMIARYEELLAQNLSESRWQTFFETHAFVLGLAFARPVHLLRTQFHAQGSSIDGTGAQIGDFLLRHTGRGLAIVEIKNPGTELIGTTPYRNTRVFPPSKELSGAVTQVLFQQSALRSHWLMHQAHADLRDSSPDAIKCIVIAGRLPSDEHQLRSFDIFRNACKDVEVVTFDELLAKLRHIHDQLNASTLRVEIHTH